MAELSAAPVSADVAWTSIYSPTDEFVIPAESARLCPCCFDAENVELVGEAHLSLLLSPRVMGIVVDRLSDLEEHPRLVAAHRQGSRPPLAAGGM